MPFKELISKFFIILICLKLSGKITIGSMINRCTKFFNRTRKSQNSSQNIVFPKCANRKYLIITTLTECHFCLYCQRVWQRWQAARQELPKSQQVLTRESYTVGIMRLSRMTWLATSLCLVVKLLAPSHSRCTRPTACSDAT